MSEPRSLQRHCHQNRFVMHWKAFAAGPWACAPGFLRDPPMQGLKATELMVLQTRQPCSDGIAQGVETRWAWKRLPFSVHAQARLGRAVIVRRGQTEAQRERQRGREVGHSHFGSSRNPARIEPSVQNSGSRELTPPQLELRPVGGRGRTCFLPVVPWTLPSTLIRRGMGATTNSAKDAAIQLCFRNAASHFRRSV